MVEEIVQKVQGVQTYLEIINVGESENETMCTSTENMDPTTSIATVQLAQGATITIINK